MLRAFLHEALNYHVPWKCPFCRGRWVSFPELLQAPDTVISALGMFDLI